ncbi:CR1-gamma [Human mastadenovirus D]|nr:CR1-gamma [Human mastadenovirus D]
MKAFTACVLISIITFSLAAPKPEVYTQVNVTRGGNATLDGPFNNNTWTRYHDDGKKSGWMNICEWSDPSYTCHSNGSLSIFAFSISSGKYKVQSYTNSYNGLDGYEKLEVKMFNLTVIEPPTTRAPTTVRTTKDTTQPTTVPTTHPTTTASTTIETTTQTTVQNTTLLIGFLLRGNESTTDQTEATSSAFSSTANLTSLAWTNETGVSLMHGQPYSGLDIQITFLVVCGIFILVVLLYFVCCKAREKSRRPIYRPVIGDPQPLQVEGGLRNLLFSFSVW